MFRPSSRKWRNWQTHQLEGLAVAIPWGFESPLPHHSTPLSTRLRRAERLAHGEPSIRSNVLSEWFASRRLEKRESKDWRVEGLAHISKTMASSSRMHYVYLLRCSDNSLYVGQTSNLRTREQDHNDGRGGSYTAKRRPVHIVYAEQYSSRDEALSRERQIKRWSSEKKQLLVRGDVAALSGRSQRARIRTGLTWSDWLARPKE